MAPRIKDPQGVEPVHPLKGREFDIVDVAPSRVCSRHEGDYNLGVFGHRHAWMINFSACVKRGGQKELSTKASIGSASRRSNTTVR